ncbi:MAG: hypothetical protein NWF00_10710 [Candidatus Bathyarchaeota archaeon]|nr:hypothetical protein [Candidatus Bathyarchaeota archaeon]
MKERLIEKLSEFGFSDNQAKVYVAVACSGCTTVPEISKATKIHPQDIYKMLLMLEKKGLILRTVNRPVKVEAISVEKGLDALLDFEKQRSEQRLKFLNQKRTEIEKIFRNIKKSTIDIEDVKVFVLQTESLDSSRSKVETTFENMEIEYDLVVPVHPLNYFRQDDNYLEEIAKRGLKIRILIITGNGKEDNSFIENMASKIPKKDNCELRTLEAKEKLWFVIIDFKEVWIPLYPVELHKEKSSVLLTDSKVIAAMAKHEFETLWNHPNTQVIRPHSKHN